MIIQVYTLTSNAEEAEVEQFYEDLQDVLKVTPKKDVLFIIGDILLQRSRPQDKGMRLEARCVREQPCEGFLFF